MQWKIEFDVVLQAQNIAGFSIAKTQVLDPKKFPSFFLAGCANYWLNMLPKYKH